MGAMSQGHRSQLAGTSTGQMWDSLSTKLSPVMNYKPLKTVRAHESIPIINKWGKRVSLTEEHRMPNGKCRSRARVRKPAFCNLHSKDWFRQQSSMDAKPRRHVWWRTGHLHGHKAFSPRLLSSCKVTESNYTVQTSTSTLTGWVNHN